MVIRPLRLYFFETEAVYGSTALKNLSFGRKGIGDSHMAQKTKDRCGALLKLGKKEA